MLPQTIDILKTRALPLDIELKKVEFEYAKCGTIGLESAFGALNSLFPIKTTIKLLTRGKNRFGISSSSINVGEKINATLFNPNTSVKFTKDQILSKSKNAIFENETLNGSVYGVINNNKICL